MALPTPARLHGGIDSASRELRGYRISLALAALACALTPAYTVRWRVGFYPTTLLEVAVLFTVAAFVVESVRLGIVPSWRSQFAGPVVIFIVAGAVSVVVAPDRRAALGVYRAYLLEPIAFFFVISTVADSVKRALIILAGLAAAGTVVGVANSVVVLDAIRHHTLNPAVTAPVVIYTNANDVALFLVPLIAVAASLALYTDDQRVRLLSSAFLLVSVVATLLSFSRGGYLALAAVALGLALSHNRRWWLVGGAVAAGIVLILIPPINHRLAVEVDFSNGSNTLVGRFELWRVSLQMLQHHVPFGAGLSGFAQTIAPYWNPTHIDRFIYPHNIVLTFWSETGLLGLFAFAWIMVIGFTQGRRGWQADADDWRGIGLGVVLALVAVVVHGLVDVPYFKNDLSMEFWALVGLALVGSRRASEQALPGWRRASRDTTQPSPA